MNKTDKKILTSLSRHTSLAAFIFCIYADEEPFPLLVSFFSVFFVFHVFVTYMDLDYLVWLGQFWTYLDRPNSKEEIENAQGFFFQEILRGRIINAYQRAIFDYHWGCMIVLSCILYLIFAIWDRPNQTQTNLNGPKSISFAGLKVQIHSG